MSDKTVSDGTVVAVDTAVVKRGRGRPRKYDYPSELTCVATGRVVKTNPSQFQKMLAASGVDVATFIKGYKCRSARKAEKIALKSAASAPAATAPVVQATAETVAAPAPVEG
jgi:hypothetical protein